MMDQERWDRLRSIFDNEKLFSKKDWIDGDDESLELNLQDWLDCDSRSPSGSMIREFSHHGYRVYAGEQDSFGWLTGVVQDKKTGREIVFG